MVRFSREVKILVITTINSPTRALVHSVNLAREAGVDTVIIGDLKTPPDFEINGATYLSVDEQKALNFVSAQTIPHNSYSRKMFGYLLATSSGADLIFESDDDNYLYPQFFSYPKPKKAIVGLRGFFNHYTLFTDSYVWPRGYPLNLLGVESNVEYVEFSDPYFMHRKRPLCQGIADGNPDVDAIFRLVNPRWPYEVFKFEAGESYLVEPQSRPWLPLNSQTTTWPREMLPLMYLPATCSFRMTDIWRGYIAQRILRESETAVILAGPLARQERNEHDLMSDFAQEVEGYVGYNRFIDALDSLDLANLSYSDSLGLIYSEMVQEGFFLPPEIEILEAWLSDCHAILNGS